MTAFTWVADTQTLQTVTDCLNKQKLIAVDTEGDSLYSYFEKVCLLQISANKIHYIIDPLAVDIAPLASIFASTTIEKIFHAAEYDIMSLRRDYGFSFNNIFDTMLAAKILNWERQGLGDILEIHFSVKNNKKYQQYNWGKRPLDKKALQYAYTDTLYLTQLREIQLKALKEKNCINQAKQAFEQVTYAKSTLKVFDPSDFWRIKGAKNLNTKQQAMLQALFVFRDKRARKANRPPFKIMNNSTMYKLVLANPKSISALKRVKGLNPVFLKRYGRRILSLLRDSYPAQIQYKQRKFRV